MSETAPAGMVSVDADTLFLRVSEASRGEGPSVAVVGAGAFGGWTALHLARAGAEVTLLDAWGGGHARASSGGETRVVRAIYGPDAIYVDWVARSLDLWEAAEREWATPLYTPTGALWLFRGDDGYVRAALPGLRERGMAVESLSLPEAELRYPQVAFGEVTSVWVETRAGFVAAREACRRVQRAVVEEGGRFLRTRVEPGPIDGGRLARIELGDGTSLEADRYVFACGPWLGGLFPELLSGALTTSRQEVHFFGTPPGDGAFDPERLPVWIDFGERVYYGVPGNRGLGFKVADDTRGAPTDPDEPDPVPDPEGIERLRALLAERFPRLAEAPLLGSRVCPYTNTPDGHLLLDRHPGADNVWLAGGGSGHGFKMAPAVGEHVAGLVLDEAEPLEAFSVSRIADRESRGSQFEAGRDETPPS